MALFFYQASKCFMPSSVIAAMKYYPGTSVLRVIFVSGIVYDYKNVPKEVYEAMKAASSKGKFLNEQIKGEYEFKKIN
jgi:hypothetical protein